MRPWLKMESNHNTGGAESGTDNPKWTAISLTYVQYEKGGKLALKNRFGSIQIIN